MYWPLITGFIILSALCAYLIYCLRGQLRLVKLGTRVSDQVLRNIAAYVLVVDPDFNVLRTNYYSMTGTRQSAVPPKVGNLLQCRNGEDAGLCGTHELCSKCPVRAAIAGAFRSQANFSGLEAPMVLYINSEHTKTLECEVCVSGNYLTIGGKPRLVLTVNDITAQKQAQRDLTEARLRAEESDRMKSQFLANTSHELRTPLNAIVGFSELLATDLTPEEKQEYVRIIRVNNEVLLQLVNDILDLSKIEAGTLEYTYSEVELNTIMGELEGLFRMKQLDDSPTKITFCKRYTSCYIRTDRKRLTQVVANFLSNAVKFTPSGHIDFGFEIREEEVYIYVTDTGSGIPEERQQLLFQRFVKIGSHKQGVGIGLAISKSIVESMGGKIGVESREGEGSTFWFTLPTNRTE